MTIEEARRQFPLGCRIRLTEDGRRQYRRQISGTVLGHYLYRSCLPVLDVQESGAGSMPIQPHLCVRAGGDLPR